MNSEQKVVTSKDELPIFLSAKELQHMGISRAISYRILNRNDIPVIHLGGKKLVDRDKFFEWIEKQTTQKEG